MDRGLRQIVNGRVLLLVLRSILTIQYQTISWKLLVLLNDDYIAYLKVFPQIKGKIPAKYTSKGLLLFIFGSRLFLGLKEFLLEVVVELTLQYVSPLVALQF